LKKIEVVFVLTPSERKRGCVTKMTTESATTEERLTKIQSVIKEAAARIEEAKDIEEKLAELKKLETRLKELAA